MARCYPVATLAQPPISTVIADFLKERSVAPPTKDKRKQQRQEDAHVRAAKTAKLTPITQFAR